MRVPSDLARARVTVQLLPKGSPKFLADALSCGPWSSALPRFVGHPLTKEVILFPLSVVFFEGGHIYVIS